jgi:hypothetical protein
MKFREWLQELLDHPVSAMIATGLLIVSAVTLLVVCSLALWPLWVWLSQVFRYW